MEQELETMEIKEKKQAPRLNPEALAELTPPAPKPEPASALSAASRTPASALSAASRSRKEAPKPEPTQEPVTAAPPAQDGSERVPVCDVQFRVGGKIYFFDPGPLNLKNGDHVIIDTARGSEYGYCVIGNHRIARRELVQPLRRVLRVANAVDERIKADNERREKEAYAFCQRKIEDLGLEMQLVSAECAFDGSKLLFFFTADNRVDFRELVKILASNFHTRIELRQIGVRDKAKMLGGLGICGRPFCCASFLDDFQPVSIKMAKTQNLSLNPTKISGTCGRLMCCLKYEQDTYEDLIKTSPKADSFVDTPDGRGTVTGVNLMRQSVSVRMEKDPEETHTYRNCDICVLRSGKAKKNDPPIPEDLAPISGRREEGMAQKRLNRLDQRITVDPAEAGAEELPEPELPAVFPEERTEAPRYRESEGGNAPRRGRKNRGDRSETEKAEEPAVPEKKPRKENNQPGSEGSFYRNRRSRGDRAELNAGEKTERQPQADRTEKPERADRQEKPSRSQRRRQQQGKPEPKAAEQTKSPAPEKRVEGPAAPKPEGAKKPRRRYYHNRKPKG